MTPASIDVGQLVKLVWTSALAGLIVTAAFALVILGLTRTSDMRRTTRGGAATAYAVLGVMALLAFAGTVAYGVSVIVSK